jgi:hypothetical protein
MNWLRCLLRGFAAATASLALGARLQDSLTRGWGDITVIVGLVAIDVRMNGIAIWHLWESGALFATSPIDSTQINQPTMCPAPRATTSLQERTRRVYMPR